MLGIKDLKTGLLVEKIEGKEAWVTMVNGELVIVKLVNWSTSVTVPRGVDFDIVAI
ncbi:hypothetical protein [Pseudomonas sp.]|uniref:hypothetical protein n=1 Tax=Pseudomonas sp. TaxID=306 RepID=UPI00260AFA9A|nr:hypothetical protein [Pseudomonas sp.]